MPSADELATELAVPGTLTICLALLGEPAAVIDESGEPDGYNVAFARELASRMGLTPSFQQTVFGELTTSIRAHACDVSVSSQNITDSRAAAMALTPYTQSVQPVLVYKGNPLGILELGDLCGRTVSAASGSTHVDFVNGTGDFSDDGLNETCRDAGEEPVEVVTFETETEAVQALVDGEVNAYLGNPNFYYDFVDDLDFSGAALPSAVQGIATALDRPLLTQAVRYALDEMIADGTYRSILLQYLLTEENAEAVSIAE
jgi:polar amino acid transport system substrate-binding protein